MICSWCEERFERFLDGEVTPADRARVLAHVDTCENCRSLLAELRVVDALLQRPRAAEPAPNFTHATMATIRDMPPPRARPSPVPAYLVCYVIAAWALIAAGFVLDPYTMHALSDTSLDVARTSLVAIGGVLHVVMHLGVRGELSSWTTLAGGVVLVELTLAAILIAAARYAVPRWAERGRS